VGRWEGARNSECGRRKRARGWEGEKMRGWEGERNWEVGMRKWEKKIINNEGER
jgi:hypothetical protein